MEKFTVDNGQAKSKWDVESMDFERPSSFDEAVELFGEKAVKTALWTFSMSDSNLPVWLRGVKNADQSTMDGFFTTDHSFVKSKNEMLTINAKMLEWTLAGNVSPETMQRYMQCKTNKAMISIYNEVLDFINAGEIA